MLVLAIETYITPYLNALLSFHIQHIILKSLSALKASEPKKNLILNYFFEELSPLDASAYPRERAPVPLDAGGKPSTWLRTGYKGSYARMSPR